MLTAKRNVLETLKPDGKPDRLVNGYVPFVPIMSDPIYALLAAIASWEKRRRRLGTRKSPWPEGQHAAMPHVTNENKVLKDITTWRETLKIPDVAAAGKDPAKWETALNAAAAIDHNEQLVMGFMGTGVFEQLHFLMGSRTRVMNFLMEPEAMHELIEMVGAFRLAYIKSLSTSSSPTSSSPMTLG
jgi:hypothetical protein